MISKIENIICAGERLSPPDIHFKDRSHELKEARQIIMYFARKKTEMSWKAIANYFGLKQHATAISGVKQINNLMDSDIIFKEKINKYEEKIKLIPIKKPVVCNEEALKTLEFEVTKLEIKISDLREFIEDIKIQLKFTNE